MRSKLPQQHDRHERPYDRHPSMTITAALQKARARLRPCVASWREDAETLLAHALGKDRSHLFAHGEDALSLLTRLRYRRMISRRMKHEPIQYITGIAHFFGHTFSVYPPIVLIPRPETELLVARAIALLKERAYKVVDVGTGSGCIAISVALAMPDAHVTAIDYSCGALDEVAKKNAELHGVQHRITFIEDDLLTNADAYLATGKLNSADNRATPLLFVMNLPYLSEPQMQLVPPEVRTYEPHLALLAGTDGLDAYRRTLVQINDFCIRHKCSAALLFEIDPMQAPRVPHLIQECFKKEIPFVSHRDLAGRERMIEMQTH